MNRVPEQVVLVDWVESSASFLFSDIILTGISSLFVSVDNLNRIAIELIYSLIELFHTRD